MSHVQNTLPEELAVAVIGMSGRFPGADNVQQFWQNLKDGVESISTFEENTLREKGVPEQLLKHDNYVKAGASINNIEYFDPAFFDMTPREAEITDPQHRVLLECAHEALENAGYVGSDYPGSIAVYGSVGLNTYLLSNLMPNQDLLQSMGMHQLLLGNDKCYSTSRIAYKLNLKGPCLSIDTACSSGLVSILTAYKSLLAYDCDMALAGSAKVNSADTGYLYEPGSINSPDGHCRTFDAEAGGTVFGSGAGMLLLKRLDDALDDNDNILAIIRGGAINNDGSDKVGFTAPSVNRQRDVIEQALDFSEVPSESISYVEAHGTGTRLGDPVELDALNSAFADSGEQTCLIGSVKTNIGHLESAAGVAGLIKVVCALNEETIPATLNYATPNPAINFANGPFNVVAENTPWPKAEEPRRACVSSFGLGGTNAHLIVEEAPESKSKHDNTPELLLTSAKCTTALHQGQTDLQAYLTQTATPLKDVAYTLALGRTAYEQRSFAVVAPEDVSGKEASFSKNQQVKGPLQKLAWIIPGQGNQHLGMSRDLYARFDIFKQSLDECCGHFEQHQDVNLKTLLLAQSNDDELTHQLTDTRYAQPAIFTHAYAMAKQLLAWGIKPDLLLGHSLGEYVVAVISGVLTLEDGVKLVAERARLMAKLPNGAMLGVSASEAKVRAVIGQSDQILLDVAAINSPHSVVLSGCEDHIDLAAPLLSLVNIDTRKLMTSHAFHSHMMEAILEEFRLFVARINFKPIAIPYVSSLTGELASLAEVSTPEYWARHLRETVQFGNAMTTLQGEGVDCVMDLGPSTTAAMLARDNLTTSTAVISCSVNVKQTRAQDSALLEAVGQYWSLGGRVDWPAFYGQRECYRAALPGYRMQKQRYWIDPVPRKTSEAVSVSESTNNVNLHKLKVDEVKMDRDLGTATETYAGVPRNDIEKMLVDIWQELLGVEKVSITDSFFDLGGQSLLATRVITHIYEKTGIELDASTLFDAPTIEEIAIAIIERQMMMASNDEIEKLLVEMEQ